MLLIVYELWAIMRSLAMNVGLGLEHLVRRHLLLAVIVLSYCGIGVWLGHLHTIRVVDQKIGTLIVDFLYKIPQMVFLVLFWRLLQLTYVDRAADRMGVLKGDILTFLSDRDRLIAGFATVTLMTPMLITFAQIKTLIPLMQPFSWDVFFMHLDKTLHLGVLPHEYLHAIFGADVVLSFFTGIYNIWLFLLYFVLLITCLIRPDSQVRMQYLVAFIFTWAIGGNLVATWFSSAGPAYYANLGLGNVYGDLMARLNEHAATGALSAVQTQELLWRFYSGPESLNSISAFPSMHVASSTLMAIYAFSLARWAGIAMSLFTLGILIGSVLLGWHYAVDGYASVVLALLCWRASGWLVRSSIGPFATS